MRLPQAKHLLLGLYCVGLAAYLCLLHYYSVSGTTFPDSTHKIAFDGNGTRTYLSAVIHRECYLVLWLDLALGVLSGAAYTTDLERNRRNVQAKA